MYTCIKRTWHIYIYIYTHMCIHMFMLVQHAVLYYLDAGSVHATSRLSPLQLQLQFVYGLLRTTVKWFSICVSKCMVTVAMAIVRRGARVLAAAGRLSALSGPPPAG